MKQVLMRRINGRTDQTDLVRVNVLSEENGKMRVKVPGQFAPLEINASDTLSCRNVEHHPGLQSPVQAYNFPGSLARDLNK